MESYGTPYLWTTADSIESPSCDGTSSTPSSYESVFFTLITRASPTRAQFYEGNKGTDFDIHKLFTAFAKAGFNKAQEDYEKTTKVQTLEELDRRIQSRSTEFKSLFLPFDAQNPDIPQGYLLLRPAANSGVTPQIENTTFSGTWCEWSRKRIKLETCHSHEAVVSSQNLVPKCMEYELIAGSTFTVSPIYTNFVKSLCNIVEYSIGSKPITTRFTPAHLSEIETTTTSVIDVVDTILDSTEKPDLSWLDPLEPLFQLNNNSAGGILFFFTADPESHLAQACKATLLDCHRKDIVYEDYTVELDLTQRPSLRLHTESDWLRCPTAESFERSFSTIWFKPEVDTIDLEAITVVELKKRIVNAIDEARTDARYDTIKRKIDRVVDLIKGLTQFGDEEFEQAEVKTTIKQHFKVGRSGFKEATTFPALLFDYVYKLRTDEHQIYPLSFEVYQNKVLNITGHCEALPVLQTNAVPDKLPVPTGQFQAGMFLTDNVEQEVDDLAGFDKPSPPYEIDLHYKSPAGFINEMNKLVKQVLQTLLSCTPKQKPETIGYYAISSALQQKATKFVFEPPCTLLNIQNPHTILLPVVKNHPVVFPSLPEKEVSSAALTVLRHVVEEALTPSPYFATSGLFTQIERILTAQTAFPLCPNSTKYANKAYTEAVGIIKKNMEKSLTLIQHTNPSGEQSRLGAYGQGCQPLVIEIHRAKLTDENKLSFFCGTEATNIIESIQIATNLLRSLCVNESSTPPTSLNNSASVRAEIPFPIGTDQDVKSRIPVALENQPVTNLFSVPGEKNATLDMEPYYDYLGVKSFVNKAGHILLSKKMKTSTAVVKIGTAPGCYSVIPTSPLVCTIEPPIDDKDTYCNHLGKLSAATIATSESKNWFSIPVWKQPPDEMCLVIVAYISFEHDEIFRNDKTLTFSYKDNYKWYLQILDSRVFDVVDKKIVCDEVYICNHFVENSTEKTNIQFEYNIEDAKRHFFAFNSGNIVPSTHKKYTSNAIYSTDLGKQIGDACQGVYYSNSKDKPRATFCVLINAAAERVYRWLQKIEHGEPRAVNLEASSFVSVTDEREAYMLQLIRDGERNREALAGNRIQYGGREQSALVVPAIVLVKGPHQFSLATAMRVDGYVIKSSVFRLMETECIRRLRNRMSAFRVLPSIASPHCMAATFHKYKTPITLKTLLGDGTNARVASLAKLMLLTSELNLVQNRPNQGVNKSSLEILGSNIDSTVDDCLFS